MTKREVKKNIIIEQKYKGGNKIAYYMDLRCEEFSASWTTAEIKEEVYQELKARGLLEA